MALASSVLMAVAMLGCRAFATDYYVDCSQASPGNGTMENPWNSLYLVNEPTFQPGDVISFKAGSSCIGEFRPKGSGTAESVIHITKYVDSDAAVANLNPVINGNGSDAALKLVNQDFWRISNLEVVNPESTLAARQGMHITSTDGTTHTGITVEGNFVHDVAGQTNKTGHHAAAFVLSCGILVDTSGDGSRYDDILVQKNRVSDCGGGGIKVRLGSMENRGRNVRVTQNDINACGGDGIIASFCHKPLLDNNTVSYLGTGKYPWTGGNFAGIWVLGDYNPTISHNVVYGSIMSAFDSQAFDCDWGNEGTCIIEFNFSRDNAGGAFLNCDGCDRTPGGANQIVRYNIFQNDCRIYSNGDRPKLSFFNNVMYCPHKNFEITVPRYTDFINNIFVGNMKEGSTLPVKKGIKWKLNVFHNVPRPTNNGIEGDPGFIDPGTGEESLDSADGYRLKKSSPALSNGHIVAGEHDDKGQTIAAEHDFYNIPVSNSTKPNRGAYNGPGL